MIPSHRDFLRAIIAAPDDDLPRLAYADWLEESGEAELAEFIRVQCELAKPENRDTDWVDMVLDVRKLAKRENELACHEKIDFHYGECLDFYWTTDQIKPKEDDYRHSFAIVRRGFIAEIHLTLSQFFGGECGRCDGEGRWYDNEGYYERGWRKCKHCHGTGRTPALGPQIFRDHPVERVVITDREPFRWGNGWAWQSRLLHGPANSLLPESVIMADTIWYRSYDDAVDGASYLCCRWARAEADKLEAVGV